MIRATEILSKFVYNLRFEDLPAEVIECTKMFIVDYYAACMAGYKINIDFNNAMRGIIEETAGKQEATVLFSDRKECVLNAAYMNAVYSHGADMDDGNRKAMGHIAAHVMSAVFALAEKLRSKWSDVIVAVNAGYEVYNRVSAAAQPGLVHRGFHSTGTAGAIACGAACAKLMGLDEQQTYYAMSIAAVQASGLFVIMESGQCCKPINPANAARAGLTAAMLAQRGIHGPEAPLESAKGWFHAMTDEIYEDMLTDGLGETFTICESYLKPYPACRHMHCAIEAAIDLRNNVSDVNDIQAIRIYIYRNAINSVGVIKYPKTLDDSKFSIYYATAIALHKGRFAFDDLPVDNLTDEIRSTIEKITLIEDDSMEDVAKGIRGAKMVICTRDGTEHEKTVPIPKGDAANPFTWDDIKNKLLDCASGVVGDKDCAELLDNIKNLSFDAAFCQPTIKTIN